ncbi:T9SS type A sorting domain-containing protein [Oceanihabitans sp. 2_MG-2023]|uniref:T9SS type A sorting domain-containing protein n=1 Tax=Oceanihabitans sp. 2_MG-2023 TaxID=3062661 RepID=UPI0026E3699F|nr:T9SS type A sorting domain-containing protein [Oceanihabitans sp. 2_MG-2023]MDO6597935.1 T9SS type A sorting domain-containing protein [Oceanihabitans sp. 2_MG-2023]
MKKIPYKHIKKRDTTLWFVIVCFLLSIFNLKAQVPDPEQGLRAEWMKGAVGMLWLPERNYNGNIEGISIDDFIAQINDLRAIDYVQLPLTSPNIFSPVHVGPHPIIESLWQGDTDTNGDPINLVVPRASEDDPLLSWLLALRAAGLKTEIYVNSYNLLARNPEDVQEDYPDVSDRWMEWCDTNTEAQTFINSQSYHNGDGRRQYMFCYAEFILKEYAMRYGDLIDAWCFDSADNIMEDECGDDPASSVLNDQRIYQAFADACHAGNPNAAISFNNSVGDRNGNPFTTATYFDDYTFGHPFGGAGNMVVPEALYTYNHDLVEFMSNNNGFAFRDDTRTWNDNVVAHFFPKQSATSWNAGNTPCLTDAQFVEWTSTGIVNGGAITWGTPLVRTNLENNPVLTLQPYALTQFELTDAYLKEFQYPGEPNWSRQYTILPNAYVGIPYSHTLTEGFDFWDPEGNAITSLIALDSFPSWLTITETTTGVWTLSGTPTETINTDYEFTLQVVNDASIATNREVELSVLEDFVAVPSTIDVQIQATENTTYSSGAVTMTGIGTVPGYDTTFEINITVTPNGDFTTYPNAVIVSGLSDANGNSSLKSWGISDDGTNNESGDRVIQGDQGFSATISDARVGAINGTSGLTTENIIIDTFKSITIVNAHSVGDRFVFSADGSADFELGRFNNEPTKVVDLVLEAADTQIESFTIKNGLIASNDKWSVEGITVTVVLDESSLSIANPEVNNIEPFQLFPNPAKHKISLNRKPAITQIFDITGKSIRVDIEGKKEQDISTLNSGLYILKIQSMEGNVFYKKFIKK